jgi:hypothetical protein
MRAHLQPHATQDNTRAKHTAALHPLFFFLTGRHRFLVTDMSAFFCAKAAKVKQKEQVQL